MSLPGGQRSSAAGNYCSRLQLKTFALSHCQLLQGRSNLKPRNLTREPRDSRISLFSCGELVLRAVTSSVRLESGLGRTVIASFLMYFGRRKNLWRSGQTGPLARLR